MPKIDVEFSLTFRFGDTHLNQYSKVGARISDIDVDVPLEPQLENSKQAVEKVWDYLFDRIYKEAKQVIEEEK